MDRRGSCYAYITSPPNEPDRNQGATPMTKTLSEELVDFRTAWRERVPPERQAQMERHIAHLAASGIAERAKQVGDVAPAIRLRDQHGADFDVATLLANGPVIVTFYRAAW